MKKLAACLLATAITAMPAMADTIGTLDISVPESWILAKETEDESIHTYIYAADDEVVIFVYQDTSFLSEDMQLVADLYLFDCDSIFGNYEGYYLMTDIASGDSGSKSLFQQCVYRDEDGWQHAVLGSKNFGGYVLSVIYEAVVDGPQLHIGEYTDIVVEQFGQDK